MDEIIKLSKRAANMINYIDDDIKRKLILNIAIADSFDDLPEWAKEIITDTEKKYNIFVK